MPRKTKDVKDEEINKIDKKSKTGTNKKEAKSTAKKETTKKKTTTSKSKAVSEKKETTKKTASTKKSTSSVKTKKANSTKKVTTKSKTTSKKTSTRKKKSLDVVEYYDLPSSYDKTVIKVLAQTPKTLFVYWEISNEDVQNFKKIYGDNFFETTKPVLIVHNDSMNYSFEVEINDFANSWYLHVNDAKCDYRIEIGRKPIPSISNTIKENYVYITSSNEIEAPNDKILFDKSQKMAFFRNVKTNTQTKKDISTISFIKNIGKIYNIYDLYKEMYKEDIDELYDLSNPSSGNPSSGSLSSKFM